MIACGHACNMTALLGHRVSRWGDPDTHHMSELLDHIGFLGGAMIAFGQRAT